MAMEMIDKTAITIWLAISIVTLIYFYWKNRKNIESYFKYITGFIIALNLLLLILIYI